jgi:hypothetical protein
MHILMLASEAVPWVKTGGLGDVVGALPGALAEQGHQVTLVLPKYRGVEPAGATVMPVPSRIGATAAALTGLLKDGIVNAAIPSLAKAIGKDAEWRQSLIDATVKSALDIADAMLNESDKP